MKKVFLSAVSSECGTARRAIASDLRSRGLDVKEQTDFRQEAEADTTLRKLHDYIKDCWAVVCIVGKRSGGLPPPAAVEQFKHLLPAGISRASYTQWEFIFARHYKRRFSIYIAGNTDGLPFLDMKLVGQEDFDEFVNFTFGTDGAGVAKGMIEVIL